jgi:hypothetical protein
MTKLGYGGTEILIPICEYGGFGDIIAGMAFVEYCQKNSLPYSISFDSTTSEKKFLTASGLEKLDLPVYDQSVGNKLISICPVGDRRNDIQSERSKSTIRVYEYDKGSCSNDYERNELRVETGFGFSKSNKNVQAGIYVRENLEFFLRAVEEGKSSPGGVCTLKENFLESILKSHEAKNKKLFSKNQEGILNGKWSLAYTSSLNNDWYFLDILDNAQKKHNQKITLFTINPIERRNGLKEKAKSLKMSYLSVPDEIFNQNDNSQTTVIELGEVSDKQFREITGLTDCLSLVTGDHSLTQMIQKGNSKVPVPFFYHIASWKGELFRNFLNLLKKADLASAQLFAKYGEFANPSRVNADFLEEVGLMNKNYSKMDLSSLVYDEQVINSFNKAISKVKKEFINERKRVGVENPETLWSVTDSVGFVIRGLLNGKTSFEAVEPLLSKEAKKSR